MSLNKLIKIVAALIMLAATNALAAPYAAIVVEPSSGKVLHAENPLKITEHLNFYGDRALAMEKVSTTQ